MPRQAAEPEKIEARSYFVRERNSLLTTAQFSPLYMDHYLHLMQHGMRIEEGCDLLLKEGLAAITLHLCARPWNEVSAWTVNFQEPRVNIFVTGSSLRGNVVGRVFREGVKEASRGMFCAQVRDRNSETRQSTTEFEGSGFFGAVEEFYRKSEQRPARYFDLGDESYAMLSAQPDCDMTWFHALDLAGVLELEERETLSLLEKREYAFDCGCDLDRICRVLLPFSGTEIDDIFQSEDSVEVQCPRCGAVFTVTRHDLDQARDSDV